MPYRLPRDAVLVQLIDQGAREDDVEELVQVLREPALRLLLPGRPPEHREGLDVREQRTAAVGELRRRRRRSYSEGRRQVQRHDADRVGARVNDRLGCLPSSSHAGCPPPWT